MKKRSAFLILCIVRLASWSAVAGVDYWPACADPQPLTVAQESPIAAARSSAVASNGLTFGVVAINSSGMMLFSTVYADGSVERLPVVVPVGEIYTDAVELVWNGAGYAVAYQAIDDYRLPVIMLARLDQNGSLVGPASLAAGSPAGLPSLAWSGSGYGVAFGRNGSTYVTTFDSLGQVLRWEIEITSYSAADSDIAWSHLGNRYVVAYRYSDWSGLHTLWTRTVSADGQLGPANMVCNGNSGLSSPSLVDTGTSLGLAWVDNHYGLEDIVFCTLAGDDARRLSGDLWITNASGWSGIPELVWTGAEYATFFGDSRGGKGDVFHQRVARDPALLGANYRVSSGVGVQALSAAFATRSFLVGWNSLGGPVTTQPWGCHAPGIPSCPEGLTSFGLSGSTLTIGWLPAQDPTVELAYYQVYRDAALIGVTAKPYFTDTAVDAGRTYTYIVRSVNAAQYFSTPCPNSQIDVTADGNVFLTLGRSESDLALSWVDRSPRSYRVMRGLSPQDMIEIARTSNTAIQDQGAALGATCFYYSIDPAVDGAR